MTQPSLARRATAEFVGTAFLVLGVVGSGIMAERRSTDPGLQLFENAFATAGILLALILALGPVSGAHFNPVVSLVDVARGALVRRDGAVYIGMQIAGGVLGTIVANLIFDLDAVSLSTTDRSGANLLLSEVVATIGLLLVIHGVVSVGRPTLAAATVAGYIGGAYFFTSSTSFANPAVTIARMFSDTFAGIDPSDAVGFVGAQLVGGVLGGLLIGWLFVRPEPSSPD